MLIVQRMFRFVPAEWYGVVMRRNSEADFSDLTTEHHRQLLMLIRFRHKVRHQDQVRVQTEDTVHSQQNIRHLGLKIASSIVESPQHYTPADFINIFKVVHASKKRMNILTPELVVRSADIVQAILGDLSFTDVETFMCIYAMFSGEPDLQLMELLKFDLYRKAHTEQYHQVLFRTIVRIKDGQLTYKGVVNKGK